ncbi:hypothetical protein [Modestobacter lapidis]
MARNAASIRPADAGDLLVGTSATEPLFLEGPDVDPGVDADVDADVRPTGRVTGTDAEASDSVVVYVQLRPRRPAVRKCLAALVALAAEHESVGFALAGLSKDDRIVRVTVGIDLGPRAEVAKFSTAAQAAYRFVDAVFTGLYDHMPVYVAEPSEAERAAAVGVLTAVSAPRPFIPLPRRGESSGPSAAPVPVGGSTQLVRV